MVQTAGSKSEVSCLSSSFGAMTSRGAFTLWASGKIATMVEVPGRTVRGHVVFEVQEFKADRCEDDHMYFSFKCPEWWKDDGLMAGNCWLKCCDCGLWASKVLKRYTVDSREYIDAAFDVSMCLCICACVCVCVKLRASVRVFVRVINAIGSCLHCLSPDLRCGMGNAASPFLNLASSNGC